MATAIDLRKSSLFVFIAISFAMRFWEDELIADDQCLPVMWLTRWKNLCEHHEKRNTGNPVYLRTAKLLPSLTIRFILQLKTGVFW
jgi:hypothetical protein